MINDTNLTAADARRLLEAAAGPWPLLDRYDDEACASCGVPLRALPVDREQQAFAKRPHALGCRTELQHIQRVTAMMAVDCAAPDALRAVIRLEGERDEARAERGQLRKAANEHGLCVERTSTGQRMVMDWMDWFILFAAFSEKVEAPNV